eukprot:CAMPEP_0197651332 /NCGR_PEP_ID=MMETSP1338-20131121/31948_1 /TAXON_ID=43686 ORGANISM="Pelagodinium beii, Strain RCC1491" /NCGR_SAMPLE_ID=MMETSP1338 /ASSEMBLY_ACC=CAM_ASM_000754 /LENGTH=33 /DNA_ID= /DNA_START= /DNA_END= /DNA_ORIENTATION=
MTLRYILSLLSLLGVAADLSDSSPSLRGAAGKV